jgi:dihydroorotase
MCLAICIAASIVNAADEVIYDLLLKGGHVIDPANNINEKRDVAIAAGKIAAVAAEIPVARSKRTVNVNGLHVSPGFIDIHAHVGTGRIEGRSAYPADMNFSSGLTTIVDAGTWGARDFHLLKRWHIDRAQIRILAFLNVCSNGMGAQATDPNEQELEYFDPALCAETIRKYPADIVGVKTAHYWTTKPFDDKHQPWTAVDKAVEAGRLADVPVMVDFWPRPERPYADLILKKLRPGDIHTHVFAQQFPIVDSKGKLYDHMMEARKRGVIFDLGHGAGSFWFRNAAPAIEQGFVPDTISTDLHLLNVNGPVVDMITTMSKILALGVPLEDVIRRSTVNSARAIRRKELGTLSVGNAADIAVFEHQKGKFGYSDCGRAKIVSDVKLKNYITIRAGKIVYDPEGISMVYWKDAPPLYFTTPALQDLSPRATAEPDYELPKK